MIEIVQHFSDMIELHRNLLKENTANYVENNKLARKINKLWEKIIFSYGIEYLIDLAKEKPNIAWAIAMHIRDYEPIIAHEIYEQWYLSDPKKNWGWEFVLPHWDESQIRIEEENKEQIARYKQMKAWK